MTTERQVLNKTTMGIAEGLPLELAGDSPEDLRRGVQMLLDIEAIKRLKHAYFRCIDTANFEELETIFHPDVLVHFKGGTYEWKLQGREEYLDSLKKSFTKQAVGHHNGHHPEIRIESDTEATGDLVPRRQHVGLELRVLHDAAPRSTGTATSRSNGRWTDQGDALRAPLRDQRRSSRRSPAFAAHYLATHGADVPDGV